MEMIMISPSQLKVTMDADDMKKYALICGDAEVSGTGRRVALRNILKKAWEETGFSSEGKRILVKMFPSRDGGCEMFVTRLGDVEERRSASRERSYLREGMRVYVFPSFTTLAAACLRLFRSGYTDDSAAYRDSERGRYYLALSKRSPLACEMGGTLLRSGAAGYINEYCSPICGDAVALLAQFA